MCSVCAQYNYMPICDVREWVKVDEIKNSLDKGCKSLIYTYIPDDYLYHAIVVVYCDEIAKYWHIIDDSIVVSKGTLKLDSIFLYKNFKKTGILQKERVSLAFIPPATESIVYQDSQSKFYFETGTSSYKELPERKKYREEWLKIIRRELNPIIDCD